MRVEKKIKKANKFQFVFVSIASSFVGLINGLLGAGGGSLVVPIYESGMKLLAKLDFLISGTCVYIKQLQAQKN